MPGSFSNNESLTFTVQVFKQVAAAAGDITYQTETNFANLRFTLTREGNPVFSDTAQADFPAGVSAYTADGYINVQVTSAFVKAQAGNGVGRWVLRATTTAWPTAVFPTLDTADVNLASTTNLDAVYAATVTGGAGTVKDNAAAAAADASTAAAQATEAATQASSAATDAATAATQATDAATQATLANEAASVAAQQAATAAQNSDALNTNLPIPSLGNDAPNLGSQVVLLYWLLSGLRRTFDATTGRIYLDASALPDSPPGTQIYYQCWADSARTTTATSLAEVVVQDSLTVVGV